MSDVKKVILFLLMVAFHANGHAQVVSAVSESKFVNITKDPPKPPYLEIVPNSITFSDPGGNNMIDANEQTSIRFSLTNSGSGSGFGLKVLVEEKTGISGLDYSRSKDLPVLEVGKTMEVTVPVSGKMNTTDGLASFSLTISEPNGFGTDPFKIEIPTRSFQSPNVIIVDHKVSSQSTTTIQKRRPFDLEVLVQNTGRGRAENIKVELIVPQNIFCLSANEVVTIPSLESGKLEVMSYNFVSNNDYNSEKISFTIKLSEKHGKYASGNTIDISMNQPVNDIRLTIEGQHEKLPDIVMGSLTSEVDRNIPVNPVKHPERIALIIGNENYSGNLNAEVNVEFARNDAQVFRSYALSVLGVKEENMFFLTDVSAARMRREIDLVTELLRRIGSKAELVFFYAGHGFPDESNGTPFLIPVDVDGTNLSSAIPLSEVYQKFSSTGASRITVFLDACFSGGGRNEGLLAARGVRIKPQKDAISGNMVVFAASSNEQSALPLRNEKHGLFTYYLLKKLQETQGRVTYGELEGYLRQSVGQDALRKIGKPQDPEVLFSPSISDSWRNWNWQ